MKNIDCILIFVFLSFSTCKKNNEKQEILTSELVWNKNSNSNLTLFQDSTYILSNSLIEPNYEDFEKFIGKCRIVNNKIDFNPKGFGFSNAETAVIKNNYIEFLDGDRPLKFKILNSKIKLPNSLDLKNYDDFAFFTFNPKFYGNYVDAKASFELNQIELERISSILKLIINQNLKNKKYNNYVKQCIPYKNLKNEKVVYVKGLCKENIDLIHNFKIFLANVHGGGDCYFEVNINLSNDKFEKFSINDFE